MAAISRSVPSLLSRGPSQYASLLGGAADVKASQPIPLYIVTSEIEGPDFLEQATPVAWRYLITGGGSMAMADVKESPVGTNFDSLIRGPMAERFSEAASAAEKEYGTAGGTYEPRVLEIPSLYIAALWLHGEHDVFFPILEGVTQESAKIEEDPSFVSRVVELSIAKRRGRGQIPEHA